MHNRTRFIALRSRWRAPRLILSGSVVLCLAAASIIGATSCSKTKDSSGQDTSTGRNYTPGKKVLFGLSGDSERFRVSGWSTTEKEITWTEGPSAVLEFTGIPSSASLRLTMTLAALVTPPRLPAQPVEVYANGKKLADWEVIGKAEFTALVPPRSAGDGETLRIEFRIPKSVSPKQLGLSDDPRVLGVSVFDLTLNKID
jgi:hypothetical protein